MGENRGGRGGGREGRWERIGEREGEGGREGRWERIGKGEEEGGLVSCIIKALVSCTSSVRCHSGSRLGERFPVSVTAHALCISSCLVPAHVQI